MSKFFAPIKMASQFVDSDLFNVVYTVSEDATEVDDGAVVTLGDFVNDPIYTNIYTAANGSELKIADINVREATYPGANTALGVCFVDIAEVPTAIGGKNTYRLGSATIGLKADAGVVVRARKVRTDDVFMVGDENFASAPTVGQYAILTANDTRLTPDSDGEGATGAAFKVIEKRTITQGVEGNATGYVLLCVRN